MDEYNDEVIEEDVLDLIDGIKSKRITTLKNKDIPNAKKMLECDSNGKTLMEYVKEFDVDFDYGLETKLLNDEEILFASLDEKKNIFYNKHNNLSFWVNEEILFKELENGKTYIENLIILNKPISYNTISEIQNPKIIDLCYKYHKEEWFKYFGDNVLFSIYNGKYFIEQIYDESDLKYIISYTKDIRIIELLNKINRLDLLKYIKNYELLMSEYNGSSLIEWLIKNNKYDKNNFSSFEDEEIYFILKKINRLDLLKLCPLKVLLTNIGYDKYVIEEIINSSEIEEVLDKIYYLNNKEKSILTEVFIRNKKYNYFLYIPSMALRKIDDDKTILDLALENYDAYNDNTLAKIKLYDLTNKEKATVYIKCSKKGLIRFLPELSVENLLSTRNGEIFIEELLRMDSEETMKIIPDRVLNDPKISPILKLHNIERKKINVSSLETDFEEYLIKQNLSIELSDEKQDMIYTLRALFMDDQISEEKLIDVMISSYSYLLSIDDENALREINMLINLKKENKDLYIVSSDSGSYYKIKDNKIYLNGKSITVFNHELGHALHHIFANYEIPKEYEEERTKVLSNPEFMKHIQIFSSKYKIIKDELLKQSQQEYDEKFDEYFTKENIDSILENIKKDNESIVKLYKEKGYKAEDIKLVLDEIYDLTPEEYIEQHKRIKTMELYESKLNVYYPAMASISDILDAISKGRFFDKLFKNDSGDEIKLYAGHGINYYNTLNHGFDEVIANYQTILKCDNKDSIIEYMKYLLGNDFVDMLDNFYHREIMHEENYKLNSQGGLNI